MSNSFFDFIPKYSLLPVLMYVIFLPVYFVTKLITANAAHYDFSISLDARIPFISHFIWIYVLAYLQWVIGYVIIAWGEKASSETFFSAELIGKTVCGLIFILIPTTILRPEVTGETLSHKMTELIYRIDSPSNLFPSLHCHESWLVMRGVIETGRNRGRSKAGWNIGMFIFTVLVCISVVTVKQHLLVDIVGGILIAELAIFISKKLSAGRIYTVIGKWLHIPYYLSIGSE